MSTSEVQLGSGQEPADTEASGSPFVTTRWSVVLAAGGSDGSDPLAALQELCSNYWTPLYGYARRFGCSREEAEDLTQSFFQRLLAQGAISRADPALGRFRSFLLSAFKHFMCNQWEKGRAKKRGGGSAPLRLDFDTAEGRAVQLAAVGDTPDRAFDRQWALALLDVVLRRLRQEYGDSGREDLFLGLKDTLAGERSEIPYREMGVKLGLSEGAVKVAAHRLRKRYRELLRQEIANTVAGKEEIEQELRHLFSALSS